MKRFNNIGIIACLMAVLALVFSVTPVTAAPQQKNIIMATTTSTQDSGLLDVLLPVFEKETGYFVKTIAVGSGQAMAMGQKGEADVLLVHSPAAEKKFIAEGYGIHRRLVMHNDYIIVGPKSDPANIKGTKSAVDAFNKIAAASAIFMSRGSPSIGYANSSNTVRLTISRLCLWRGISGILMKSQGGTLKTKPWVYPKRSRGDGTS
jgi:tungstate transport system substrate-binding protein